MYIVRVNEREEDDVIIFDECILPEYPSDDKLKTLAQAAREQDEERTKREEVRKLKSEIEACKNELQSLDYKAIKRMQGDLDDDKWEEACSTCKRLRGRINELETELEAYNATPGGE